MITNKLSIFINNKLGLYSKRQCVDIATNIGKELVDLSSSGAELTTDLFQKTIKKYSLKFPKTISFIHSLPLFFKRNTLFKMLSCNKIATFNPFAIR